MKTTRVVSRLIGGLVGQAFLMVFVVLALPGLAHATLFNFDVTFDGVSATLDATSDPVVPRLACPASCCTSLRDPPASTIFWAARVMKVRRPLWEEQPLSPRSR